MANPNLFHDDAIDPVSLSGVNHADVDLTGKRHVVVQFDPLTTAGARLYFRLDDEAAAGGTTIALLKPEGYLTAGGLVELWLDPDEDETPTLHLLMTDSSGTAATGGANDRVLILANRHNPD